MKIVIINGPNINLLGSREPDIYGIQSYHELCRLVKAEGKRLKIKIKMFQSNAEGNIIDLIQRAHHRKVNGLIINPGAYTHYSYAIYDALMAVAFPIVEVHLSDITMREDFRKKSVTAPACRKVFMGQGFFSYLEAIQYLVGEIQCMKK
jgi:3-dehydroquinate dehydratase-2